MSVNETSFSTKVKVGLFSVLGLLLIGFVTVLVNDRPMWWKPCQLVHINVADATGLKTKSPVRSLGLQIGYLRSVDLYQNYVKLGICITASVKVLSATRAYIRGEGFMGDKFVELKPVKYTGDRKEKKKRKKKTTSSTTNGLFIEVVQWGLIQTGLAEEKKSADIEEEEVDPGLADPALGGSEIPVGRDASGDVQEIVNRVDALVGEVTELTSNLKTAINPEELKDTMGKLNAALENAAKTFSPDGGLTNTAQKTLIRLEDAIAKMQAIATRINNGEGSVGKIINDPVFANELEKAVKNVNYLLGRATDLALIVDFGLVSLPGLSGSRGAFHLGIWPAPNRYYRLGVASDPRGSVSFLRTETTVSSTTTTVSTKRTEPKGFVFTGMLGILLWERLDLSAGVLHGDGAGRVALRLGFNERKDRLQLIGDVYSRAVSETTSEINFRLSAVVFPYKGIYLTGGMESLRQVSGSANYFYGAGISFRDQDIKLLFSFL